MENNYNPKVLLSKLDFYYKFEGKLAASVDLAKLKKTYIKILMKDPSAPPYLIKKDPNKSDWSVLLLAGNLEINHNSLEKAKDDLGSVEVSYEGREPVSFKTYQEFLAWL